MSITNNLLAGGATAPQGNITNPLFKGTILESLSGGTGNPNTTDFLNIFIPNAIGLLFVVGVVGFMFMMIWGAVQWIFSGGDKGAIEGARGRITNALLGIILLLSTFAIIKLVETFFGINILTIDIAGMFIQ